MGKVGKQVNAPGFYCVHRERKQLEDRKKYYLSKSWFVTELEKRMECYKKKLRTKHWKQEYKLKWNDKREKYVHVKMSHEEWMYEHIDE